MLIGVTGTHGIGKSTLIDDFQDALPDLRVEAEPYWQLSESGIGLSQDVTVGDLEAQLQLSCSMILQAQGTDHDIIFDRSPFDFLAYLEVVSAEQHFEWLPSGKLLSRIGAAVAAIDLLVFIPLTERDEISVLIEQSRLRTSVDRRLKRIILSDELGLLTAATRITQVHGTRGERLAKLVKEYRLAKRRPR